MELSLFTQPWDQGGWRRMLVILGNLGEDLWDWHQWANQQPVTELLKSSYARGRLECYYGIAVGLQKSPILTLGRQDHRVQTLGDRLLPGWHSALLCKYLPGIGINPHRDHTCFSKWATMVNLGEANFFEYVGKEKRITRLEEGAIVRLNTKILHGVEPVSTPRYSLTFRHLKAEYSSLPMLPP